MMITIFTMAMIDDDADNCVANAQGAYKAVVEASHQIFNQKLWYIMVTSFHTFHTS